MSTRYSLNTPRAQIISARFGSAPFQFAPRYNIAPGQSAPVVLMENGKLTSRDMKWGWTTPAAAIANVPTENIRQPIFRAALTERRCLIPADGFYEWKDGKPAHPYRIVRPTRNLFWFAGLWEKDEFAILTNPATGFVEFIHDREPIAIPPSRIDWWLTETVLGIVREGGVADLGISNSPLEAYPVTPQATDPQFESPQCLEPFVPTQKDNIQHAIDDPDLRWHDVAQPPTQPRYVTLLINDEKTVDGQWSGRDWKYPADAGGRPLKWCPPTKFVHRLGANQ